MVARFINRILSFFLSRISEENTILLSEITEGVSQERNYKSFLQKYSVHPSFRFNGPHILFYGEGEIHINENTYIGGLSTVQAVKGYKVSIGKRCKISHNVRIYTATAIADQDFGKSQLENKYGNVVIEDNVWIGANVFINPGVTIGENSVIGANAVVTKNVEPFTIVAGVPAKMIRRKNIAAEVNNEPEHS